LEIGHVTPYAPSCTIARAAGKELLWIASGLPAPPTNLHLIRVHPWFETNGCFLKMQTEIQAAKIVLRKQIYEALEKISPAVRAAESIELCDRLEPQLQSARTILFFAPLPDEPDVWPLLEKLLPTKKICALPAFDSATGTYSARRVENLTTDIAAGKFGIREPSDSCVEIPLEQFDLILVPTVAFDWHGRRLGRGRGFYDRLLAKAHGIKCGVAFDRQMVKEIPAGTHDVRMDFIVTPTRCLRT
jgi:5-formyltetrahydrofolate cyclo-ligase